MKNKTNSLLTLIAIAVIAFGSCTNKDRQDDTTTGDGTTSMADSSNAANGLTDGDREFVAKAASGGMMEVELGKIAQQNGGSSRVKEYGAMLERDHSQANSELKSIAESKSIQVPAEMNEHHRSMVADMQKKKGADFDKAYISMMVEDHNKDIDEFRKQGSSGGDADLKAFASKTLPVLEMHLDSAKAIHKNM